MTTIYDDNGVTIEAKPIDKWETEILVNGKVLIVISAETENDFRSDLSGLLDQYRI